MKTSNRLEGGSLLPEHYTTYARYFLCATQLSHMAEIQTHFTYAFHICIIWYRYLIRFLEEYEKRGVHLSAMTVQNEPLQNDNKWLLRQNFDNQSDWNSRRL